MHFSTFSLFAGALLYVIATLATLAAIAFMGWSAWLVFDQHLLQWQAAIATAGALLAFALLLLLARHAWKSFLRGYRAARRPARRQRGSADPLLDPAFVELVRRRPRSAVLVAMVAGTALGASPEMRRKVGCILRDLGRVDDRDC